MQGTNKAREEMKSDSYSRTRDKQKYLYRQERDDLRRFYKDALYYLTLIFYCLLFLCTLAGVLFLRTLFEWL